MLLEGQARFLQHFEAEHVEFRLPWVTISPAPLLPTLDQTRAMAALSVSILPLNGSILELAGTLQASSPPTPTPQSQMEKGGHSSRNSGGVGKCHLLHLLVLLVQEDKAQLPFLALEWQHLDSLFPGNSIPQPR